MSEDDSMAEKPHGETVSELLDIASDAEKRLALITALTELNNALKPNPEISFPDLKAFSSATLARFLHYYALTKMLEKPGRRASDRPPKGASYELLCSLYNVFQASVLTKSGMDARIFPNLMPGTIRDYCSFHTFATGSSTEFFYSSLALFVVELAELDELESDFFRKILPANEASFPNDVGAWLLGRAEDIVAGAAPKKESPSDRTEHGDFLTVGVNFNYGRHNKSELDDFISEFQIEEVDSCAHFICYRPRLSEPRELMKTFLTLKPSWALHGASVSENTNFNHFYAAPGPRNHHYHRISNGRAIPLDEGVYLIGGHKLRNRDRVPFRSVEVISFEWSYLKNTQTVFPALMISANNRDTHLATRIAVRATPLHHSTKVSIGAIGIQELADDVRDDLAREESVIQEHSIKGFVDRQHKSRLEDADAIANSILDYCNNLPPKWRIDAEYVASSDTATEALTPRRMEARLEEVFGSDENPLFFNEDGQPFNFWESMRFGVLSSK